MTRTGRAPKLGDHLPEPYVDLHAQDALRCGVREGELARVTTHWGSLVARLRTSGEIARGSVFVPIHWSASNASDARVGALVNPVVDPISGEPEFKHTPARVEPMRVEWYGVIYLRDGAASPESSSSDRVTWWARVRGDGFLRYEIAGRNKLFDSAPDSRARREGWARQMLGVPPTASAGDYLDYEDASSGIYRAAYIVDGRVVACVFVSSAPAAAIAGVARRSALEETHRRHRSPRAPRRPPTHCWRRHRPTRLQLLPCRPQDDLRSHPLSRPEVRRRK